MPKQILKFFQKNYVFVPILLLAVVLRFSWLSYNPPSLNWDEISHGYNAYSILKTGKDEWGQTFPRIFRAYGDYKLPAYIYLTSISEFFFGLNAFAIRLPSVLAGIAIVVFTYLLTKELFDKKIAIISSLLVAIEPWSLFLSRGAFEANLALAFIISGTYFFISGTKKAKLLPISAVLLGLSVWTYNSARVFVPLLFLLLIFLYKKELLKIWRKNQKVFTCYLLLIAFFFLPMFWQLFNPVGQARYGWVAILDEGAITQINEARNMSQLSPLLTRLVHNKGTYFISRFVGNWFSHFSLDFLFLEGGNHYQFSMPGHGLIYPINLVFFILGLIVLVRKQKRSYFLFLGWLVLAPIPSSLTREAPHVLRAITMLPMPMIVAAVGLVSLSKWLGKRIGKILLIGYLIILLISIETYLTNYFTHYRTKYSWSWQYGYEQAIDFARANYEKYDKIVITKKYGEPHEFFLFFWPWDPWEYINDPNLIRFYQTNWYWVDTFDKFYFVNDWDIATAQNGTFVLESGRKVKCQVPGTKCLLITSPENFPKDWDKLQTIDFLDGKPAFEIYEN